MPMSRAVRGGLFLLGVVAVLALAGGIAWLASRSRGEASGGPEAAAPRQWVKPDAVFLIVVDTLRSDRLSCYGYEGHATPNIDRLATAGVRFTRAHTVASWTCPSMGAMLTSRYPAQLGLVEAALEHNKPLPWRHKRRQVSMRVPDGVPTIAEMMAAAGFKTAAFVNQPALNANTSYARGFGTYLYPVRPDGVGRLSSKRHPGRLQNWDTNRHADVCDALIVEKFSRWLGRNADKRPFAWLHLLSPHTPYNPPEPYAPAPPGPGQFPSPSARYDGEVRSVDAMIGDALDAIEQHVGLERSLVILTADHGEEFKDHGHYDHGHSLYREIQRVPLLVAAPRTLPAGVVERDVRIIDIVPTILEFVGQTEMITAGLEGVSLMPAMAPEVPPLPVFAEGMLYGNTKHSLVLGGYKLILEQPEERCELYDVHADEAETVDLASQQPERVTLMLRQLADWHAGVVRDYQELLSAVPDERSREELDRERERTLEALRSLGYIDDEDDAD